LPGETADTGGGEGDGCGCNATGAEAGAVGASEGAETVEGGDGGGAEVTGDVGAADGLAAGAVPANWYAGISFRPLFSHHLCVLL